MPLCISLCVCVCNSGRREWDGVSIDRREKGVSSHEIRFPYGCNSYWLNIKWKKKRRRRKKWKSNIHRHRFQQKTAKKLRKWKSCKKKCLLNTTNIFAFIHVTISYSSSSFFFSFSFALPFCLFLLKFNIFNYICVLYKSRLLLSLLVLYSC